MHGKENAQIKEKKEGKKNKEALIEERECESEEKEKQRRGGASPRVCSCVLLSFNFKTLG